MSRTIGRPRAKDIVRCLNIGLWISIPQRSHGFSSLGRIKLHIPGYCRGSLPWLTIPVSPSSFIASTPTRPWTPFVGIVSRRAIQRLTGSGCECGRLRIVAHARCRGARESSAGSLVLDLFQNQTSREDRAAVDKQYEPLAPEGTAPLPARILAVIFVFTALFGLARSIDTKQIGEQWP
jgi:hypothetical protein